MSRLALIAVLLFFVHPSFGATIAQYRSSLTGLEFALNSQVTADRVSKGHAIVTTLPVAEKALARITTVTLPDGGLQPVRNQTLLQEINRAVAAKNSADIHSLVLQLELLNAEANPLPARHQDAAASVALAHLILAEPAFASLPFPPPSLPDRIANWLNRQLAKIHFPHVHVGNGPDVNVSRGFILGLLYCLLAGVICVLVFVLVQILSRQERRARAKIVLDAAEEAMVEARDNESLFAMAERFAQSGEYRRAFRMVYLATLIALDIGGVLRFNRSRTNWEYLRDLRKSGRSDIFQSLAPFTREFDRVWYGFSEATVDDYQRAAAQYHALQSAAPTVSTVPEQLDPAIGPAGSRH